MNPLKIFAGWKSRPETPKQIARRLDLLITLLRPINPSFRRWYHVVAEDDIRELVPGAEWLVNAVARAVSTGDLGEPAPALGYLTVSLNSLPTTAPRPDDLVIDVTAGSKYINAATLRPTHFQDLEPSLCNYSIFRQAVLAYSRAFEPDWCDAGPFSLWKDMKMSDYVGGPVITPCWMIYLSPKLAQRITPPPDVVSERFRDGSLFMAVTEQRFDPDDPSHVTGAYRMFDIIDTLQAKLPIDRRR